MYDPENKLDFLTENEKLFEKVSINRLVQLIEKGVLEVWKIEITDNTYGEWLWINCRHKIKGTYHDAIAFYSNFGFHYKKEEFTLNRSFSMYETSFDEGYEKTNWTVSTCGFGVEKEADDVKINFDAALEFRVDWAWPGFSFTILMGL